MVFGTSLSPCLLNQTPLGIPLMSNLEIKWELSATLNVGLKSAPLKITNLLSSARSVKGTPFIMTVGASVSGLWAVALAELSSLFR